MDACVGVRICKSRMLYKVHWLQYEQRGGRSLSSSILVCCLYDRLVACFSAANGCVSAQHYVGRAVLREIWSALRQTLFEDSSTSTHSSTCVVATVQYHSFPTLRLSSGTQIIITSIAMSQYDSDLVATLEKASTGGTSRFYF